MPNFFQSLEQEYPKDYKIASHRGYGAMNPSVAENTLTAFLKSTQENKIFIHELDVRITKDNIPILFHGPLLQKNTNGLGRVENKYFSELKKLNWGTYLSHYEPITTLEDYLKKMPTSCFHNLELKKSIWVFHSRFENKVLSLIKLYGTENKILISSFNWLCIWKLRRKNKTIALGLNIRRILLPSRIIVARLLKVQSIHLHANAVKSILASVKKHFYIVIWGENSLKKLKNYFRKGVFLAIIDNIKLSEEIN